MKTNRSAAKRFKLTGTGKVKRAKAGGHHLNAKKARKRKRRLNATEFVSASVARRIKSYI